MLAIAIIPILTQLTYGRQPKEPIVKWLIREREREREGGGGESKSTQFLVGKKNARAPLKLSNNLGITSLKDTELSLSGYLT
jgi:hypothetical protein